MNIALSFFIPSWLLVGFYVWLGIGFITFSIHLIITLCSNRYDPSFDCDFIVLIIAHLIAWPLLVAFLIQLFKEERQLAKQAKERRSSYFIYNERNHIRSGGELDFY